MRRSPLIAVGVACLAVLLGSIPGSAAVSRSQQIRADVFKLLNDGIHAYKEGRYKDAIPLLEQASDIALNSFRAYYYYGLALKADRRYLQAIEPLSIALELDPVSLQARVALGDCYLLRGDPAEALAEYHRALSLQDDYAPAFDGLGRTAEAAGDTERAIEHFRRAIDLNPGFPDPALNLGDLYLREGRNTEAIGLFLSAIRVRPDFAAAYNRLGVAYSRLKQSNQAIAALRHAQTLEQGNAWHPVTIGRIFMGLNSLIQAEREFDKALEVDPDYLECYIAKATLLRRLGRIDEAVQLLDEGSAREVEAPREFAHIDELRAMLAEDSARQAALEAAIATNGRRPEELAALAQLKSEQGNYPKATEYLTEALDVMRGVLSADPNAREMTADPNTADVPASGSGEEEAPSSADPGSSGGGVQSDGDQNGAMPAADKAATKAGDGDGKAPMDGEGGVEPASTKPAADKAATKAGDGDGKAPMDGEGGVEPASAKPAPSEEGKPAESEPTDGDDGAAALLKEEADAGAAIPMDEEDDTVTEDDTMPGNTPLELEPVTEKQLLEHLCYDALMGEMYKAAATACEDLLKMNGASVSYLINLGLARVGMADNEGAIEALQEASRLQPGNPLPLAYLGNVYLLNRNRPEAVESLTASLSLMSEDQAERQLVERLLNILAKSPAAPSGAGAP